MLYNSIIYASCYLTHELKLMTLAEKGIRSIAVIFLDKQFHVDEVHGD